jgi:hypothetical protein
MIYLFHGSDIEKVRSKAFEWVAKARAKEPNLAYVRLSSAETTPQALADAAESGGLFVKRLLVLVDDPFENKETAEIFEDHLDALAKSDNAIVVLAPKLAAPKTKKLIEKAAKEYSFDKKISGESARGFNTGLVNALGMRSREKLWLEIQRALRAGDAPEMLHGLLHWKARDVLEKGNRSWSEKEARQLSLSLIEVLRESRRGGLTLEESLERFALSI